MIVFFIFHMLFASILGGALALVFGALTPWISWLSLIAGAAIAWRTAKYFNRDHADFRFDVFSEGSRGLIELILTVFVMYVAFRHYMWLFFPMDHSWATLSAFNFGDLPLHINYIRYIALGGHFPPVDPIFAAEPLRYPFGVDFYSALWESIGVPLRSHLFLVGIFGAGASLVLLRAYGGWWAVIAFFLSGGWLGWSTLTGQPLASISDGVEWKNLFLSLFLTQRGFLFALPAGLFLLQVFERHISGRRKMLEGESIAFGLLWGFLTWFHLHAFLVVSVMMAMLAYIQGGVRSRSGLRGLFQSRAFMFAFLPALMMILYSTEAFQKASIAHWVLGWTYSGQEGFLEFLAYNFGPWLFLPLAILTSLVFNRPALVAARRKKLALEFGAALFLFILFFNLMLAPWPWDNIKVLIWPYLWIIRIAYVMYEDSFNDFSRAAVALVMGLSGFMVLAWSIQAPSTRGVKIFPFADAANVEGSIKQIPIDAVFAAAPIHDHPLALLGRVRAIGYLGHLWSHGINSSSAETKQDKLMHGDIEWLRLAHELNVTHIYWGPWERSKYGDGDRVWMHLLENVSPVKGFEVYVVDSAKNPSSNPMPSSPNSSRADSSAPQAPKIDSSAPKETK